jgi:hypothetical integral membrane protein (TIGR02206 family)
VWAAVAYPLDRVLGTNYGYLVHKPGSESLLDLLGPWPWYLASGLVVIAVGWAVVLTLPWQLVGSRVRTGRAPG